MNTAVDEFIADTKVSEPHGKLYSGDVASVLEGYLKRNVDVDDGLRFSRADVETVEPRTRRNKKESRRTLFGGWYQMVSTF